MQVSRAAPDPLEAVLFEFLLLFNQLNSRSPCWQVEEQQLAWTGQALSVLQHWHGASRGGAKLGLMLQAVAEVGELWRLEGERGDSGGDREHVSNTRGS